ncbi:MAG: hypothetical protein RL660_2769 [Bacteroidota bacterium]|jgi:hypothetical protein
MSLKFLHTVFIALTLSSCGSNSTSKLPDNAADRKDTVIVHDTVYVNDNGYREWQRGFGLSNDPNKDSIWGKPVAYYISDKRCDAVAIAFYYGDFKPSDNQSTDALLSLACTDNDKLRPFYRWCLNKTIQVADGALCEHTGEPAISYAEKFPKEFFTYMDFDTTGEKYMQWVSTINYSGLYRYKDYQKPTLAQQALAKTMKQNCRDCNDSMKGRIDKFAKDCFN